MADSRSGTNVHEVADGIYRINTAITIPNGPGAFSFNQYLILDDEPLLFHTGPRRLFPMVREAVASVVPLERLHYVGLSHVEADECGALNEWLTAAPNSVPLCGSIAALVSIRDMADRAPRAMAEGETIALGRHALRWLDTPHLPHAWECGLLLDETTSTLLCGDLFTRPGGGDPPLTQSDVLGPSESFRQAMDYWAHSRDTRALLAKLAAAKPTTLACMHGSAWRGDGAALLLALADALEA